MVLEGRTKFFVSDFCWARWFHIHGWESERVRPQDLSNKLWCGRPTLLSTSSLICFMKSAALELPITRISAWSFLTVPMPSTSPTFSVVGNGVSDRVILGVVDGTESIQLSCGVALSVLSNISSEEGLCSKLGLLATSAGDKLLCDYNHINTTLNGVKQANVILKGLDGNYPWFIGVIRCYTLSLSSALTRLSNLSIDRISATSCSFLTEL